MHESLQISVNENIIEDLKDFDKINLVVKALLRHHLKAKVRFQPQDS